MPGSIANCMVPLGVPKTRMIPAGSSFYEAAYAESTPTMLIGVTKDITGAALGSVLVKLFQTAGDILVNQTTSDGSGNYTTPASSLVQYYVMAYLAGAPDRAGVTANTLTGA